MKKNLFIAFAIAASVFTLSSCNQKAAGGHGGNDADSTATDTAMVAKFAYTPAEPVNGKKKAICEMGATGFECYVVEMDKDKNWKMVKAMFGKSLVAEGKTDAATIKSKLEGYIKELVDSSGVKGKDIHFVISSGAKKEDVTDVIISEIKKKGYFVNVVSPEQEAKYAYRAAMAKGYEGKAFVVDMGSNNTKVAYMKDGKMETVETYGAKYYKKNVDDKAVYDDVKSKLSAIPAANCGTLFIIGGVPYQMASAQKRGDERYTVLNTTISYYDDLVKKEGDKAKCGVNIYKAILDATDASQVVFDWSAHFSVGFLLDLPY